MSTSKQIRAEERLWILTLIESGEISVNAASQRMGVATNTIKDWRRNYQRFGYAGLERRSGNRTYWEELKLQAVQAYLNGEGSGNDIIKKYGIASRTQLRDWITKYNRHSSLKTHKGRATAMTKGRATTWKERIEIVQYCLANGHDYQKASEQYQVSYHQVYQWVKKFEAGGPEALADGRGRAKAPEELTEADLHKLAMKKLEHENERLRAENALLKKCRNSKGGDAKPSPSGDPVSCHPRGTTERGILHPASVSDCGHPTFELLQMVETDARLPGSGKHRTDGSDGRAV
jgi:transposase